MRTMLRNEHYEQALVKNGFVVVPGVASAPLINSLKSFYDSLAVNSGSDFFLSNFLTDLPLRRKIHYRLQELLLPLADVLINGFKPVLGTIAVKPPGKNTSFGVHQDWSLVDESKFTSLSLWVPLQNVDEHNGCFRVLQGSCQTFYHPRGMNIPFTYESYAGELAKEFMVPLPMNVGDVLIFDHRLVHDSGPNFSHNLRLAAVLALVPHETEMMHYYRVKNTDELQLYALPDDFLIDNNFFDYSAPPASGKLISTGTYEQATLNFDNFKRQYAAGIL